MRRCILTFPALSGTGVQTVTGVSDSLGDFVGEVVIFQSGWAAANTLTSGGAGVGTYGDSRGVDTGTLRSALSVSGLYSGFNFKAQDSGQSLGDASIATVISDSFGSGVLDRVAKITAFRSGEFDLTYTTNTRTGDTIIAIVLAEIDITFTNNSNGTYTTPSKPQGLLAASVPGLASSGGTSVATGGQNVSWGFATRDGAYGASSLYVVNQGNNWSTQRTTAWSATLDGSTGVAGSLATVSAWGDTSFTIANGPGYGAPMVFSGDDVRCASGAITEGDLLFDTGIATELIFFVSTGYAASTASQSPIGQMSLGWSDGTNSAGYWAGEKTNGNTGTGFGARYLSTDTVIRLGTPNGASTLFSSAASVTNISPLGPVSLLWSLTGGNGEQILWFAIGREITPPTPAATVAIRRMRQFAHVNQTHLMLFVDQLELYIQSGVGNADAPDPQMMLQYSKDGGRTWSAERWMSAGKVGEFTRRLRWMQLGQARDWVWRVVATDPVIWNLIDLYANIRQGSS